MMHWMNSPRALRYCFIFSLVISIFSGCIKFSGLKSQGQSIEFYTIDYPAPESITLNPLGDTLLIRRFSTSSLYGTDRIAKQPSSFTTEFFYYKKWALNPASMLTNFIYRDLTDSGLFRAVLNGPSYIRPTYELSGTLEKFLAKRIKKGWETELVVSILFYTYAEGGKPKETDTIFQKRYLIKQPCEDDSAEAIVASLSTCTKRFTRELMQDLKKYLEQLPG